MVIYGDLDWNSKNQEKQLNCKYVTHICMYIYNGRAHVFIYRCM